MGEVRDGFVEGPGPPHDRGDLPGGEPFGVHVDHPAGKVAEDLPALPVDAVHPRDVRYPGGEVIEERVYRRGPGAGRPAYRRADPYHAAEVAREPLLLIPHSSHLLPRGRDQPRRAETNQAAASTHTPSGRSRAANSPAMVASTRSVVAGSSSPASMVRNLPMPW